MNKQFALEQVDLFGRPDWPEGFIYREDAVSQAEENELLARFQTLPFKPFEFHGFLGKRRVAYFGWRYDFAGRVLRESDPLPDFLLGLRARAAHIAGVPEADLRQASVNEYAPDAGIGWHRDKATFKEVVGFSFASACTLRFRIQENQTWKRRSVKTAPRSAYVLRGESRHTWEHSIPHVERLRYSVTFRSLVE